MTEAEKQAYRERYQGKKVGPVRVVREKKQFWSRNTLLAIGGFAALVLVISLPYLFWNVWTSWGFFGLLTQIVVFITLCFSSILLIVKDGKNDRRWKKIRAVIFCLALSAFLLIGSVVPAVRDIASGPQTRIVVVTGLDSRSRGRAMYMLTQDAVTGEDLEFPISFASLLWGLGKQVSGRSVRMEVTYYPRSMIRSHTTLLD